jgi:hypothetical protein
MLHEEVVSRPRAQNSTEGPHPRAGAVFAVPGVSHGVAGGVEGLYAEGLVFLLPNRAQLKLTAEDLQGGSF